MSHRLRLFLGLVAVLLPACGESHDTQGIPPGSPKAQQPAKEKSEYRFDIGGRLFHPEAGVPAELLARVEESIATRQARFAGAPQTTFLLVQFHEPLDRATRERLEGDGVLILDRISAHTWIAGAGLAGARSLLSETTVRWAELYPDDVKLAAVVRRPEPFDWQLRPDGQAAYSVLFHSNVNSDEVETLPKVIGDLILEEFDASTFPVLHTATLVIDPHRLQELASMHAVRWIEPEQPPVMNLNRSQAQPTSNVDVVQAAPYNLTGLGVAVGIWEVDGAPNTAPLDFDTRMVVQAGQVANCEEHPVHVAGTIGASGVNVPGAKGMAPAVTLASWDLLRETSEMTKAGNSPGGQGDATPIVASNHSYGAVIGWHEAGESFHDNQDTFGRYSNLSRKFDVVVLNSDLIVSVAAGNDRDDEAAEPGADQPPADCFQGGLGIAADCIEPRAAAKNILAVGATDGEGAIASFSSFGPADDGRIKPDLMAHGFNTLSLVCDCSVDHDGDGNPDNTCAATASRSMSGTSMATPVVTGVVALLLEEAANRDIKITAAGMKALLIQTARDMAGTGASGVGPDFATGWGIVDARAAVDQLRLDSGSGVVHAALDDTGLENAWIRSFRVPELQPELRVTLAWTDPEGNTSDAAGNPELVNDLDLRLIAPDDTVFQPWALDPANPGAAAIRNGGDDTLNTVEQVSVLKPTAGTWRVRVTAKAGSLVFGPQRFALAGTVVLDR